MVKLMLLSGAKARYDDHSEGPLGNVLFEDDHAVIAIFWSKCERCDADKPAVLLMVTGSGAALLLDSVGRAMSRLPGCGSRSS